MAIAGQSANLAPADKKIYALRDVTATVDSIPLIASSIMSKKLASGADAIVLDVKCGNGAFMKDINNAIKLADTMVAIGKKAGKEMAAVITDMNQPLGTHIGNGLEVLEVIDTLKGNGNADILQVTYALGTKMLIFAKKAETEAEALEMLKGTIKDGSALKKFTEFVALQGGDTEYIVNSEKLINAKNIKTITAKGEGYITNILTEEIGRAVQILGGGREKKEDLIDPSVGVVMNKKLGDYVRPGESIFTLYGNNEEKELMAVEKLENSITYGKVKIKQPDIIKAVI